MDTAAFLRVLPFLYAVPDNHHSTPNDDEWIEIDLSIEIPDQGPVFFDQADPALLSCHIALLFNKKPNSAEVPTPFYLRFPDQHTTFFMDIVTSPVKIQWVPSSSRNKTELPPSILISFPSCQFRFFTRKQSESSTLENIYNELQKISQDHRSLRSTDASSFFHQVFSRQDASRPDRGSGTTTSSATTSTTVEEDGYSCGHGQYVSTPPPPSKRQKNSTLSHQSRHQHALNRIRFLHQVLTSQRNFSTQKDDDGDDDRTPPQLISALLNQIANDMAHENGVAATNLENPVAPNENKLSLESLLVPNNTHLAEDMEEFLQQQKESIRLRHARQFLYS